MSWKDVANVLNMSKVDDITSPDRFVLVVLAHHRNGITGECYPSYERLVEMTGLSRDCVRRSLRHLETLGLILTTHGSGRTSNNYVLHIPSRLPESPQEDFLEDVQDIPSKLSESPQGACEKPGAYFQKVPCILSESLESGISNGDLIDEEKPLTVNSSTAAITVTVSSSMMKPLRGKTKDTGETPETPKSGRSTNALHHSPIVQSSASNESPFVHSGEDWTPDSEDTPEPSRFGQRGNSALTVLAIFQILSSSGIGFGISTDLGIDDPLLGFSG
jgi:hypothetical protein